MVRPRTPRWAILLPVALLLAAGPAPAQEPESAPEAETEAPAPPPKKRPPPKPKPKPKPKPAPAPPAAEAPQADSDAPQANPEASQAVQEVPQANPEAPKASPKARPANPRAPQANKAPQADPQAPPANKTPPARPPVPQARPEASPEPARPPLPAANLPGLTVQCEAKAALYEGPKAFALWVTRTGLLVVENPLRPLTPETTRVLQVIIGDKVATAYGPDLYALRRGGGPAALEAMLGGPIRWDSVATALPDTLNIVSETGQSLAEFAFRECGAAPAVKAPPVAAQARGKPKDAGAKPKARAKVADPDGGAPNGGAKAPPGLHLPQGAIE